MSDMNKAIFDSKKGLPNKLLQEDGTVTDLAGNQVISAVDSYENKPALPNKWLNPDGSYSTLSEIIGGAAGADLFIVVDELPATGEENKIYLISKESGDGFVEWIYADGQWDTIGEYDIDLSNYPTTEQMEQYVDDHVGNKQVFYWDGETDQTGLDFWNEIYQLQKTQPCLVYTEYEKSGKKITQSWHYNNNLPTSAFDANVISRWLGDKATSNSRQSLMTVWNARLYFSIENDTIIQVRYSNAGYREYMYLDTDENYSTPYTPQYPGSPATKKYVDDAIAAAVEDTLGGSY